MRPPVVTRAFLFLVSAHFLQGLGYASMALLPIYLDYLGASRTEIGVVMALGAGAGVLVRPLIGWSLDALGRKRTLSAATLVLFAGMASFLLVDRLGILIYLGRLMVGFGVAGLFTGYFTLASDLVPVERRTEGIALFGISGLAPLAVNPLASELGLAAPQLRWFFPLLGLLVLSSLAPLLLVPEPARAQAAAPPTLQATLRAVRQRSLWPVWWAIICFGPMVAAFTAFATVAADHRHVAHAPWVWLAYVAGAALVRLGGGSLPDRVGPARLVPPSFLAYGAAMATMSVAGSFPAIFLGGFLAGVGHGFGFPVFTSQVVARSPTALRGSALAMLTALWDLAALLLTPVAGMIADGRGDAAMFQYGAAFAALALLVWWPLERRLADYLAPE